MINKLFKIIGGLLSLIVIVGTTLSLEYLGYFFLGFIVSFIFALIIMNDGYTNFDDWAGAMLLPNAVAIVFLGAIGMFGKNLLPNIIFTIIGCSLFYIIRKLSTS